MDRYFKKLSPSVAASSSSVNGPTLLGIVHVSDTVATTLEKALDSLLSTHGLSVSSLRGQGYDGASNMRGEFNGLKSLILKRNPSAYYVHCFAHQLQLTIVAVAKRHTSISSCKRRDVLRESQRAKVVEGIASDEINTGRGLNQEKSLTRPGDTRWSSHYGTLINLMHLFFSINDVLEYVGENGYEDAHRPEALDVQEILNHFEVIFVLHLMRKLLGITHDLSQVLQKKDQDIVNAMNLVKVAKTRLQVMREKGWEVLLTKVTKFCRANEIDVLDMEDECVVRGRGRRKIEKIKNLHHYRVELFCSVIDMQAQELNHRFNEVNTDLLLCMTCFDPRDSFSAFDSEKLLRLAKYYPSEFSEVTLYELESQLDNFIFDMRTDERFSKVSRIAGLAQNMVSTRKHENFALLKITLPEPVPPPPPPEPVLSPPPLEPVPSPPPPYAVNHQLNLPPLPFHREARPQRVTDRHRQMHPSLRRPDFHETDLGPSAGEDAVGRLLLLLLGFDSDLADAGDFWRGRLGVVEAFLEEERGGLVRAEAVAGAED
ncbi:zinc finger MYM-type protein 1-like [Salvia splendens]|uniref:zinc finger MYM-type protein 1-like n=1 Tax=Salvia splendens TaxID=180675 RepID=UPI001C27D2E4|nr:zinc finger MYM-type protein 1-like [Salvia splendens]